jgi:hypothetical protein
MQNSVAKKIFAVGSAVAMTLALGAPFLASAAADANGTNISDSTGTVYTIINGHLAATGHPASKEEMHTWPIFVHFTTASFSSA